MAVTWGKLASADEARARFEAAWVPVDRMERVATADALGRVLAADLRSPEDLPPFRRALMDGYACMAADLVETPARLRVIGDVQMGEVTLLGLERGQCARVPTGGMLPTGTDVVVPVELTSESDGWTAVSSSLPAGRHIIEQGEDVAAGELVVGAGHRLRPADIGALMGLGITAVDVYALPRVGILSTGDEVVPADQTPPPGKVRDLNSYSLAAAVRALGAVPCRYGIIPDEENTLLAAASAALRECDMLLFSAGTSVGRKDVVAPVIDRLGEPGVLVHGVDIRPGKPTVFAVCGGKPVFGLPGQPVSVLNTFDQFVSPVLRRLLHIPDPVRVLRARLAEPIRSADGREDHVRVRLESREDGVWAHPILGVSAMITTLVRAHGITVIPSGAPGFEAGAEVQVRLLGPMSEEVNS